MATIDLASRAGDGVNFVAKTSGVKIPYVIGKEINLATFKPCSASGIAFPTIKSSILFLSNCGQSAINFSNFSYPAKSCIVFISFV